MSKGGICNRSDEDLFRLMAASEKATARQAFEEFYNRHAGYLYGALRWVAPALHYGRDDLVHDTFLRAFRRAKNYRPEGLEPLHGRRRVRAWLSTIADRLIKESWPRDRKGFVRLSQLTQDCWEAIAKGPPPATKSAARVRDALQRLPPRERDIILVYMHWYDPELEKQRVPDAVVDQICAHHGVTKANFRQIVSRTLKRLERALEEP